MYLKSVEIKGFKSFADKVEVEFTKGITAIVGPNGSGKSNICDAIRWVLGEQSAKTLRGSKMEDVIFAGTENRKPLSFAEVSLILDNSDNILPIEYNEVKITRRLYRSGESEYLLNNTVCRLKDIYELLMDTGIGVDGYSIIGQGKVEEILSSKPDERRLVFEEATGITKFKTRKAEAERKLENTRQNLVRINDILTELESQIGPLEIQAQKAERFLRLKDELKMIEINSILHNYNLIKQKLDITLKDIEENINKLNLLENKKEELETIIAEKKHQLTIIQDDYDKSSNISYELEMSIQRTKSEIEILKERKENQNNEKQRLLIEKENNNRILSEKYDKLQKLIAEKQRMDEKLKLQKKLIEDIENQLNEHIKENKANERVIENKRNELIEVLNRISELNNKMNSLSFIKDNFNKQYANLIQAKSGKEEKINELEEELKIKQNEYEDIKLKIEENHKELNDLESHLIKIESEIKQINMQINSAHQNIKSCETKLNMLIEMEKDLEGYNKAVKFLVYKYKNNEGFYGTVSDIIEVPNGFEISLEAALGSSFQNIVVKDETLAKEMIEYLKRERLGRATFLPITTVKGRDESDEGNFKGTKGFIGIASKIIKFDAIYKNIITSLLGRTLICDNIDNAIILAKKTDFNYKIVTLDGEIINPGGSLTGGTTNKNLGIFKRKNEIHDLKNKIEDLNQELNNLMKLIKAKESSRDNLNKNIENKSSNLNILKINASTQEIDIKNLKEKILELNKDIEDINVELEQINNQLAKIKQNENEYSEEINKNNEIKISLEKELEGLNKNFVEFEKSKEAINTKLTSEKVIFAELKKEMDSLTTKIEELNMDLKEFKDNEEKIERKIIEIEDKINNLNSQILNQSQKLNKLNNALEENKKKEDELFNCKNLMAQEINSLEEELTKNNREIAELTSIVHKLEMTQSKQESEIELLNQRIWDEYELTIPQAQKYKNENFNNSDANKKINSLKAQIKELGEVNIGAIEELNKIKERYNFLSEQKKDLIEAEESLLEVIKDMTEKMQRQFQTNFSIIRKYFNETFKELFGGGYADLRIDNGDVLESGIEIIVQPPGKKLQNITLLSGGEKGLSAIALIFSLLKFKPTPFCILDEIEAALDDANVLRFANYLKKYANNTQFILITHRKGSMSAADALYGVTMEEKGVSKLLSLKLKEA
ncbi:chromosome segregation protein SMC [Caloramator australicus]|uniref:Chromosome partition protein Smc n=1 Tax=Caloramator australicus RC3 TaxID=857293 RepID=I7LIG0_9CLOT|nr:chromosome segregation protein SMC [Caloramator australicus]CCJ32917.1 Chromosome partition protein smc [Caloramator australicus RC3]